MSHQVNGTDAPELRPVRAFWLGMMFVLVLLTGCVPVERPVVAGPLAEVGQDSVNSARLSCFLMLRNSEGPALRLELTAVEVLVDGNWLPLGRNLVTLDSAAIGSGQRFLAGRAMPAGQYRGVRLSLTQGAVRQADGSYAVVAAEPFAVEATFPAPLQLDPGDSRVLLLDWDVEESLDAANMLRPVFAALPQLRQLPVGLVYVSCPDIDTVFIVRTDRNWVVDAFGVRGQPTWLALDPFASRERLYVLAADEMSVKLIDLASQRVIDFFPAPLNDAPTFMTVSPNGRWAYLLDQRNGYLSRMDLETGRSATRVRLGYRPQYALFLEERNLLAVSLGLSQAVVFLDPLSLAVVQTITTGSSPEGLLALQNQLYVAESGNHMVSVIDLGQRGSSGRMAVGLNPRRLVEIEGQIYVANHESGTLSMLVPGQLGVMREIRGLGRPLEMAFDRFYRRLYVADEESASLVVVDVNSSQLSRHIALGARPFGLAVIQ